MNETKETKQNSEAKETKEKTYKIVPSEIYRVGVCSITEMVGKEKKLQFDSGKAIEVNKDQLDKIKALGWCNLEKLEKEK